MHTFLKRAAAFCAAAVMLSGTAFNAAAATRSDPGMISRRVESGKDYTDIVERIAQGVFDHEELIDVSSYNINGTFIIEIIENLLIRHPDIFFLDRKVPAAYSVFGGKLYTVRPNYRFSAEQTRKKLTEFYAAADDYLSLVNNNMSQLEKALVLHDAIVDNAGYVLDEDKSSEHELLVNKKGICEDYSRVYAYLLGQLGIRTEIITSDEMEHEWMKVEIGGSYYHVDITWDDPQPDRGGRVSHRFFLLSDKKISDSAYYSPHTDFECVHKSESITYDGNAIQCISSKCCPLNGKIYCIYTLNGSTKLGTISFKEGVGTASLKFSAIKNLGSFRWKCGAAKYWSSNSSGLAEYGGKLYYNSPDEIFCYDPKTGKTESIYKLQNSDKQIFGLRIKNGKLYGMMSDSPTDNFVEKELYSLKVSAFESVQKQFAKLTGSRYVIKMNHMSSSAAAFLFGKQE